jgi:hypothetical protein
MLPCVYKTKGVSIMYTKEISYNGPDGSDYWAILDPEGGFVCTVLGELAAILLLSHLNRE